MDGVERPIRRPKDKEDQKKDCRGKKKAHRKKNLLISREKRVVYLGPTSPGSVHDKKLADEGELTFPPDVLMLKDTAFQGHEPPEGDTLQAKKKPRGPRTPPHPGNHQPGHQPGAGHRRTRHRRDQTLPPRR